MGREPEIADQSADTSPVPSLEDVMKASNWDERLALARAKREKLLAQPGPRQSPPEPKRETRLVEPEDPSDPTDTKAPSIKEILTTANWNDRLEKAKQHREEVLAARAKVQDSSANVGPALDENHAIGRAVFGFRKQSRPRHADAFKPHLNADASSKTDNATPESKKAAPVVLEKLVDLAPPASVAVPERRRGIWPLAASIALLVVGGYATRDIWLTAPGTPAPSSQSATASTTTVSEPAATAGLADIPATEVAASQTPTPAAVENVVSATTTVPILTAPPSEPGLVDTSSITQMAGLSTRTQTTSPVPQGQADALPVIDIALPASTDTVTPEARPASIRDAAPEFADAVAGLALPVAPIDGTAGSELALIGTGAADNAAASGFRLANTDPRFASAAESFGTDSADFVLPGSLAPEGASPVAISELNVKRVVPGQEQTGVPDGVSELAALDWSQPTDITFLAGPPLSDFSATDTSAQLRAPVTLEDNILGDLNGPAAFAPLNAQMPTPVTPAQRVAALQDIAIVPSKDLSATLPNAPEPFDEMVARSGIAPTVRATIPTQNGVQIDVAKYLIHLNAPVGLSDEKLQAFSGALQDTGFSVKDPNRVGFKISKNNVRFFYPEDAEAAEILAAAIDGTARDFTDYSPPPPAGTIEVWLAGSSPTTTRAPRTNRSGTAPSSDPAVAELRNRLLNSLRRGDHL